MCVRVPVHACVFKNPVYTSMSTHTHIGPRALCDTRVGAQSFSARIFVCNTRARAWGATVRVCVHMEVHGAGKRTRKEWASSEHL